MPHSGLQLTSVAPRTERTRIVVLRDRERAVLHNPPASVFGDHADVSYCHLEGLESLPPASHYFFNCVHLTEAAHALALGAIRRGSTVTLILQTVDAAVVDLTRHSSVNVIPAYGPDAQITTGTLQKAIPAVLAGHRVVAHGFLQLSTTPHLGVVQRRHPFLTLLQDASVQARTSPVVAAVLALQRSGSKFLRDMVGLTVGGAVRVFHEHDVPEATTSSSIDARRPLFDQMMLERDAQKRQAIRKAILRDAIITPKTRFIFVTERHPASRLVSYFQMRRADSLRTAFDAERETFRDIPSIQSAFDTWAERQVKKQRVWYQRVLRAHFGLDVLETERVDSGMFVGRHGHNTLVVVPTTQLNALRATLATAFGSEVYQCLDRNSATTRGDGAMDGAFRRLIHVNPVTANALHAIPEVAHIHGSHPS